MSSDRWARRCRAPSCRCCKPPRPTAEHCADDGDALSATVLATADAAVVALDKTPDQLGVLAEYGVVDAGGRGLLVLLDALAATLTGHAPVRNEYLPSPPAEDPVAANRPDHRPPHYEVMYQISGDRRAPRRAAGAPRSSSATRWRSRATAATATRCMFTPTTPVRRSRRPSRSARRATSRSRLCAAVPLPGGGRAAGRCSRSSTATAPRSCSPGKVRGCCGARTGRICRRRSMPGNCCVQSSTRARARSWCCPTAMLLPRSSSRAAPRRRAGGSTWCRCPPDRWCRGWQRWPYTTRPAQPSTTATRWRRPQGQLGTVRCGSPPIRR